MTLIPKIEEITRDITISHFLLMFGYKLFSIYFPLFLLTKNFSLLQIGYTNFLIYLSIAFFSPIVGFLNHKINPAILSTIGIVGYGIYALGMITLSNNLIFYLFQIILGISAALFFVSSRAILMGFKLKNPNRSFAWFYSSPSYANAIAPAIGAVLIWKFSFIGVFVLSLILQICNAIFCFSQLNKKTDFLTEKITIEESNKNYSEAIKVVLQKDILIFVLISFLILILSGFSNTFFLIFLKDLGWSQNEILTFNSILSLVFLPISIWTIKGISKLSSKMNIIQGGQIIGLFSMILGGVTGFLNFYLGFFIMIGKSIGGLISSSGRSGLLTNKLIDFPEESAAIDTIFSPLSTAMGSLIGGLLIPVLGYSLIFIYGGLIIFLSGLFGKLAKNGNLI